MKYPTLIYLSLFVLPAFPIDNDYDLLIVRPDKCFNYVKNDRIKVISSPDSIKKAVEFLSKAKSNNYRCGYDYSLDFFKNGLLKKSLSLNLECESKGIFKKIQTILPNENDNYLCYYRSFPVNCNIDSIIKISDRNEFLLFDDLSAKRFLKLTLFISGHANGNMVSSKNFDKMAKQWVKRVEYLEKELSLLKPVYFFGISGYGYIPFSQDDLSRSKSIVLWAKPIDTSFLDSISLKYKDIIDSSKLIKKDFFEMRYITKKTILDANYRLPGCEQPFSY